MDFDVEVRYVIETPASREANQYAGTFATRAKAVYALTTWSRFDGLRDCATIRPRILPTIVVGDMGQSLRLEGGTF